MQHYFLPVITMQNKEIAKILVKRRRSKFFNLLLKFDPSYLRNILLLFRLRVTCSVNVVGPICETFEIYPSCTTVKFKNFHLQAILCTSITMCIEWSNWLHDKDVRYWMKTMEGKSWGTGEFLAACGSYCELDVEDPIEVWRLADEVGLY